MAIDALQEAIRRTKNPTVLDLTLSPEALPPQLLAAEKREAAAYGRFCRELMEALRDTVPALHLSFSAFALLDGGKELSAVLKYARKLGYYVLLDAPEMLSPAAAEMAARAIWGENGMFPCDGLIVQSYLGSDLWKPFLPYVQGGKKDLFIVARTANRSAPEMQDLLTGSRLVHMAAADLAGREAADTVGKYGYTRVGLLAAASSAVSLKNLRSKYPRLFLLLDGLDYPNANAKNCAQAFDKLGRGAAAISGAAITCAWKETGGDGGEYLDQAKAAAGRVKKNLTRYVNIL